MGVEKRCGEIVQNTLTVTLFIQPIRYWIPNDKTIVLSPENVQKVHSRPNGHLKKSSLKIPH